MVMAHANNAPNSAPTTAVMALICRLTEYEFRILGVNSALMFSSVNAPCLSRKLLSMIVIDGQMRNAIANRKNGSVPTQASESRRDESTDLG